MKLSAEELRGIAAEWRAARRLYPIYRAMADGAAFELPASPELESPIDSAEAQRLQAVRDWLAAAEAAIQTPHLRVFCQTSPQAGEPVLRALLTRLLQKPVKGDSDRDKVDFLLVQYFAVAAPESMLGDDLKLYQVAKVLEPVLGETQLDIPGWLNPLEEVLLRVRECGSMRELLRKGLLYQERKIKQATDEMYFTPPVMVAFTRFNFLVRRVFFRLMHAEVAAIREGLAALEARGVAAIDASKAQFATNEPIVRLRAAAAKWREPIRQEYGYALIEVYPQLREAVEAALAQAPAAMAAAAAAGPAGTEPTLGVATAAVPVLPAQEELDVEPAAEIPAETPPGRDIAAEFAAVQAELADQLKDAQTQEKVMTRVVLGGQRVLLSSWEVRAFVNATEEFAEAMRRGVAARVVLAREVERAREGDLVELRTVMSLAHSEAGLLGEQVAQARDARDIDAAVTLAATSKRLTQLMEEAAKLAEEGK